MKHEPCGSVGEFPLEDGSITADTDDEFTIWSHFDSNHLRAVSHTYVCACAIIIKPDLRAKRDHIMIVETAHKESYQSKA